MKNYTIKKILVPTDFSDLSLCALDHAEKIAAQTRAQIILQHVISPRSGGFGTSGMMSTAEKLENNQKKEGTKLLRQIAADAIERTKLQITTRTSVGNIASTITQTAKQTRSNLIIMGTHGATGFMENLLGSTTYRVAGHSKVPVLSVNKQAKRTEYSHIVYPVRDKAQSMSKLPFALTFARLFRARVHVIGLLRPNDGEHEAKMRALCNGINERFTNAKVRSKVSFTRTTQFPLATLQYAHKYSTSLLVIKQDHDFLLTELFRGTFSKSIMHRILSPVLTIPD